MSIFSIKYINIILIIIILSDIKGKKIICELRTKSSIKSLRIYDNTIELFNNRNISGDVNFILESYEGKKIILDIVPENINKIKNEDFSLFLTYEDKNLYLLNYKNMSIIYKKNYLQNFDTVLIKFYLPFKIYCFWNNYISINEFNNIINFNFNSKIFPKTNDIQINEEFKIKITDIYSDKNNGILKNLLINFNKSYIYEIDKRFEIRMNNEYNSKENIIIKYKGIMGETELESINECSINIKKYNKRYLEESSTAQADYYYTFGEIFDNEEALENMDDIVEFLNQDINVFNISEDFFQDLCIHYERNKADYVLEDRIEFFYQNYSLCNKSCNLSQIYFENFSFSCICWPEVEVENIHHKKEHSMELDEHFSMEGLSQEMSNIFFESNLSVIQCFFSLLKENIFMSNYGFLIITLLLAIQIYASLFLYSHMNNIRLYVFKDLIKCRYNPPLKKMYTLPKKDFYIYYHNNNRYTYTRINSIKNLDSRKVSVNELAIDNKKNIQKKNVEKNKKKVSISLIKNSSLNIKNQNNKNSDMNIDEMNIYNNKFTINKKKIKTLKNKNNYCFNDMNLDIISSQRNMNISNENYKNPKISSSQNTLNLKNKNIQNKNPLNIYKTNFEKLQRKNELNLNKKHYNIKNPNNDLIDKNSEYNDEYISTESKMNKSENNYTQYCESFSEKTNKCSNKKFKNNENLIYPYGKMDYDENDLDGLDYDEALIYDKRTFCQLFCKQLKERQLIANTFFVKDNLKPFSIKIILFIFNVSCYLVINGFLFNEQYVMKILRRTSKGFYYFLVDSITRIVYSSIIGVIINIIVGLLFRADKQLRKVQNKHKNNKILLHGEIVKIYKSTKFFYIFFTIFNVCAMLIFMFYLFCFCGVYRNCQADWFEGCFLVIMLMQLLPVLISLLLAVLRKAGLVCKIECLFKINSWIIDNI